MFEDMSIISTKEELVIEEIGAENYKIWQRMKQLSTRTGIQTVMPYELIIK
jgi:protease-4